MSFRSFTLSLLALVSGCGNFPESQPPVSISGQETPPLPVPLPKPMELPTRLGDACAVYAPFKLPVVDRVGNSVSNPICAISPEAVFYPLFEEKTLGTISRPPQTLILYLYYSSPDRDTMLVAKRFGTLAEDAPVLLHPNRLYPYDASTTEYVRVADAVTLRFIPLYPDGHYLTVSHGNGWYCDVPAADSVGNDIPNSCLF